MVNVHAVLQTLHSTRVSNQKIAPIYRQANKRGSVHVCMCACIVLLPSPLSMQPSSIRQKLQPPVDNSRNTLNPRSQQLFVPRVAVLPHGFEMEDHLLGGRRLPLGLEIIHNHLSREHTLKRLNRRCGSRLLLLLDWRTHGWRRCGRCRFLTKLGRRRRLAFFRVARSRTRSLSSSGDPTGDEGSRGSRLLFPRSGVNIKSAFRLALLRGGYRRRWTRRSTDNRERRLGRRVLRACCPTRKEGITGTRCSRTRCACDDWSRSTRCGSFGELWAWSGSGSWATSKRGLGFRRCSARLSLDAVV